MGHSKDIMKFSIKKHDTSGITYKDDGQIPANKVIDGVIVDTANIPFTTSYKLQIRAKRVIDGVATNRKKTLTFSKDTTLLKAIKDAQKAYQLMMADIPAHLALRSVSLTPQSTFKEAFEAWMNDKVLEDKNSSSKKPFNKKDAQQFYDKWIHKAIGNKPLNEIFRKHITVIKADMVHDDGSAYADRTKLAVHQHISPVYTYFNENTQYVLKNPAMITKKDRVKRSERAFDLNMTEIRKLFIELRDYPITPVREIFMWLMHGRRRGEVLELRWENIDFKNDEYTIPAPSNKPREAMTYKLTPRLKDTLEAIGVKTKGFVFIQQKDKKKSFSGDTLRNHWERIDTEITLHQIRNCITEYLKNQHEVSDEICGYILGHTQSKSITQRYGKHGHELLSEKLNLMLNEVFDDEHTNKAPEDEKIHQLKQLFPDKTEEQLRAFIGS